VKQSDTPPSKDVVLYQSTVPQYSFEPQEPQASGEIDLRRYIEIVLKYRAVIISCALMVAVCFALYAFTTTPLYTARTTLQIDSYEPVLGTLKVEDLLQQKSSRQDYLETQIQQIKSLSLADAVLADPDIRRHFENTKSSWLSSLFNFGGKRKQDGASVDSAVSGYTAPAGMLQAYLNHISVSPVRRTTLVNIDVVDTNPVFAATVANKHAAAYIEWVRSLRLDQQGRGLAFLSAQSAQLQERVADLERQLADYAEENSIVALNKDENITIQKMGTLSADLSAAESRAIQLDNKAKEARSALTQDSAAFDDSSVTSTRLELAKLEAEYAQLSGKYQAAYPKMQQLRSQIDQLKRSVREQRGALVRGMESEARAATNEVGKLKEELEKQKSLAFEQSKRQVQFNSLERELDSTRDLLQNVSKQMKEMSLAVESKGTNIAVVDRALVPQSPSHPKKMLLIALGMVLGLLLGVGGAFLLDHLDNTIRTPDEVRRILDLPTLGVVPSFSARTIGMGRQLQEENSDLDKETEVAEEPSSDGSAAPLSKFVAHHVVQFPTLAGDGNSQVSEAYRTIRTNLVLSRAGRAPRTLLITSGLPAEGKTTVAVNLAITLASAGSRVLVVDVDLRKPSVAKHFRIPQPSVGVTDVLTGNASLDSAIVASTVENVFVLPSGSTPPNPSELIGSDEMSQFVGEVQRRFDYVILDSAPLLPVTDTMLLSRLAEGVIMVVRGNATPIKACVDAKERALASGARLLGVVLNDIEIRGMHYYYGYYDGYYSGGYGDEEEDVAKVA
jgi:capsular exopolysaccharide synthesis family protein